MTFLGFVVCMYSSITMDSIIDSSTDLYRRFECLVLVVMVRVLAASGGFGFSA